MLFARQENRLSIAIDRRNKMERKRKSNFILVLPRIFSRTAAASGKCNPPVPRNYSSLHVMSAEYVHVCWCLGNMTTERWKIKKFPSWFVFSISPFIRCQHSTLSWVQSIQQSIEFTQAHSPSQQRKKEKISPLVTDLASFVVDV